jgi:DNA (cytosine-5)-methyltransferase 1
MPNKTLSLLKNLYHEGGTIKPVTGLRAYKNEFAALAQKELDAWKPLRESVVQNAPFQLLDFFSGAGGMSLGFAALSRVKPFFRHLGGCDIDPDALETYRRNFSTAGILQDIRLLANNKNRLERFLAELDDYNPQRPLVIVGCAPCQGFTSHRKKKWDEADDRNLLMGTFAKLAVQLNPVCIVMENVPELLSKKYWEHFQQARIVFSKAGYIVHQGIYNAASFGVPQERFRSLVIAMRRDHVLPQEMLENENFVSVRQAIGHLPKVTPGTYHPLDSFHRSAHHRLSTIETIRAVPKNGGSRPFGVGPQCLDKVRGYYDVYGRLHWDKPAITITHYSRNPASGRYVHPVQNRGLTMREAALLQSFPVGFEFTGSFDSVFKQIGEAVPPKFACAVAANVLVELLAAPPLKSEKAVSVPFVTEPVSSSFSSVISGLKQSHRSRWNSLASTAFLERVECGLDSKPPDTASSSALTTILTASKRKT